MIENAKKSPRARQVRQQGLAHAAAHQLSGLARQAYANKAGISVYKLDYWRTLARRAHTTDATPTSTSATSSPSPSPSPPQLSLASTHTVLKPTLFIEITRAPDTEPTAAVSPTAIDLAAHHNATSNSSTPSATLGGHIQAAAPIELHLGGAWQGHRLCLPATIDDAWLASLLNALPTHAPSHRPPLSLPPSPSSPQPDCIVKSNRANSGATS